MATPVLPDVRRSTRSILEREYRRSNVVPYEPDAFTALHDPLLVNKSLLIYRDMGRDDMVEHSLTLVIASILMDLRVIPAGDESGETSQDVAEVARFIEEQLEALPGGPMPKFFDVLLALLFGFSLSEVEYRIVPSGRFRGWVGLRDIHYLQPYYVDFETEEGTGRLLNYIQRDPSTGEEVKLAPDKAIHYVWRRDVDPFRGQSIYRPAYDAYYQKQCVLKLRGIQAERVTGKGMVERDSADAMGFHGNDDDFEAVGSEILDIYQRASGLIVPKGLKFSVVQGEQDPSLFNAVIDHCNKAIVRPTGIAWLTIEEGLRTGSYALGEIHQQTSVRKHRFPKEELEALINGGLVANLCRWNGIPRSHWPRVTFSPAIEEDKRDQATAYINAVQAGALSRSPARDEPWLRQLLGAPELGEKEVASLPMADPTPQEDRPRESRFSSGSAWWERPLSLPEQRVDFDAMDRGLQNIIDEGVAALSRIWKGVMLDAKQKVEAIVRDDGPTPEAKLRRVERIRLDLGDFQDRMVELGVDAWELGQEHARRELVRAGIQFSVAPRQPYSLGSYKALLRARAFEVRAGHEQRALSAIVETLASAFETAEPLSETIERIDRVFSGLIAGQLVSPGTPGYDITKPAIQETTVRTMMANAMEAGRAEVMENSDGFVKGIERSEVLGGQDGDRSHPLSKIVDGIRVRLTDRRWRKFTGALHYNDRGVSVPITAADEAMTWSSDAEIESAIRSIERLGF